MICLCLISLTITNICDAKHTKSIKQKSIKQKHVVQQGFIKVKATAYTPSRRECGKSGKTATMKKPRPGVHVAVSRDLKWMLGKKVYVKGIGIRRVEDVMHRRYRKRIDLMMVSVRNAKKFGIQDTHVKILN